MNLNRAMIIGNLTKTPEVRTTPNGISVTSFGVATNFIWTDASGNRQEKVEFHNIVAWRKLAEICGQYLRKGSKVYIEGRLQTRSWDDQTGNKRYITEIVADNMIMLDSKSASKSADQGSAMNSTQEETPTIQVDEPIINNSTNEIKVEEIPF
ncbi:single-stranded DNA-binding protein [Candidatus Kuenenbacteria bacterium CG08_land_8_20_14_0_20_37_23]|uniref:Single-stranded DNA-binding protein n=1 Tax=Candidatus Kuenenbacteria bacterium CG08_land_8_20_14_0_20_37_23 TaxID=1974617 RepID=A0A2M6XTQ7_9BACT|nr:MAG: single-stranded DNA-binding protein [Candidatus Kuenenbacteria bacterium CG08_land_8_20_14_0_20_37_23]